MTINFTDAISQTTAITCHDHAENGRARDAAAGRTEAPLDCTVGPEAPLLGLDCAESGREAGPGGVVRVDGNREVDGNGSSMERRRSRSK